MFIGCLQDVVMDETYQQLQEKFCKAKCMAFENTEENKLSYMTVFKQWQETVETYVEERLTEMIPGMTWDEFGPLIEERKEEVDPTLFDLLESFQEFTAFKELMLDYKRMEIACTPKKKSSKIAEVEASFGLGEPELGLIEGMELLHISGEKKRIAE